jgi:glycogen debranching enzyme
MNTFDPDNLEEMERAHYADNRVELANLLGMIIDAKGDTDYMKQMLDNAEGEVDSLTKKLSLVIEMVEDADDLEKLQKSIARIKSDLTLSGVPL